MSLLELQFNTSVMNFGETLSVYPCTLLIFSAVNVQLVYKIYFLFAFIVFAFACNLIYG